MKTFETTADYVVRHASRHELIMTARSLKYYN
jgi:hypothetical protein